MSRALRNTTVLLVALMVVAGLAFHYQPPPPIDHLLRSQKDGGRDLHPERFRCFEIDDHSEFSCLFHREVSRFGPSNNFIRISGKSTPRIYDARS